MKIVALWDVENVGLDDVRRLTPLGLGEVDRVVACVAFGFRAGGSPRFQPEQLRALAEDLFEVPSDRLALELALVPYAPETADRALIRMLREAGSAATEGSFDTCVVLSGDRSLLRAVPNPAIRLTLPDGSGRDRRVCSVQPGHWHRKVRRVEHAPSTHTWARTTPTIPLADATTEIVPTLPDIVVSGGSLASVLKQVNETPALLSLLSMTAGASRGVGRLGECLSGRQTFSASTVTRDGGAVDWVAASVPKGWTPTTLEESPLGLGAIRLARMDAEDCREAVTVLTAAPSCVLAPAVHFGAATFPAGRAPESDLTALAAATLRAAGITYPAVRLGLRRHAGGAATLEVDDAALHELHVWWFHTRGFARPASPELSTRGTAPSSAVAKFSDRHGLPPFAGTRNYTDLRAIPFHHVEGLAFRAPVAGGDIVHLSADVQPGSFQLGNLGLAHGPVVLVWTPRCGHVLPGRRSLRVAPVQDLLPDALDDDRVMDLPLVVPIDSVGARRFAVRFASGNAS